jgi:hypothetical protein
VVDANNKSVGQVIAQDDNLPVVYFKINGRSVLLTVGRRAMGGAIDVGGVAFASPDCSGQGFLLEEGPEEEEIFSPVAVVAPGNTVYLPVSGRRAQPFTWRSTLPGRLRNSSGAECIRQPPFESSGVPAQAVVNLNRVFTPPFRVLVTTR